MKASSARNTRHLLQEIQSLEKKVAARLRRAENKFLYSLFNGKVAFDSNTEKEHKARRQGNLRFLLDTPLMHLLVAPVVYGFVVPALILDAAAFFYQAIVFPVFSIDKVKRSDYISFDRGKLLYLNEIERFNCNYCAYVNGLISYVCEMAARSELWCVTKLCPSSRSIAGL